MKEYKSRVESYSREMLRKESQIKELQGRIEIGDGCKYTAHFAIKQVYSTAFIMQYFCVRVQNTRSKNNLLKLYRITLK
jgi:hypothetical protein